MGERILNQTAEFLLLLLLLLWMCVCLCNVCVLFATNVCCVCFIVTSPMKSPTVDRRIFYSQLLIMWNNWFFTRVKSRHSYNNNNNGEHSRWFWHTIPNSSMNKIWSKSTSWNYRCFRAKKRTATFMTFVENYDWISTHKTVHTILFGMKAIPYALMLVPLTATWNFDKCVNM